MVVRTEITHVGRSGACGRCGRDSIIHPSPPEQPRVTNGAATMAGKQTEKRARHFSGGPSRRPDAKRGSSGAPDRPRIFWKAWNDPCSQAKLAFRWRRIFGCPGKSLLRRDRGEATTCWAQIRLRMQNSSRCDDIIMGASLLLVVCLSTLA